MSAQAKQIALSTTNALKQSVVIKTHKIKQTTNFPLSLITQIQPSLKNKFKTTKTLTTVQSLQYENDMTSIDPKRNALIIESEDQDIIDKVNHVIRYIYHHSAIFHVSRSRNISPTARPSVHFFRRPEYRQKIDEIVANYNSRIWCFENTNKFGIFCTDTYKKKACVQDIGIYINSVAETDLDYIRCNEIYKTIYFMKTNKSFVDLMKHCTQKYGNEFSIESKHCDRGYVWIWSKHDECRKYIKQYLENDINDNWMCKYINIGDDKVSLLFGRPHNDNNDYDGGRYNEFGKMFKSDQKEQCLYFYNDDNKKCRFQKKYIANFKGVAHKLCIVVNVDDYDNEDDARQVLDEVDRKINDCLTQDVVTMDFAIEYQNVLTQCFTNDIHWSVRWSGDMNKLYVKHDDNGKYEAFQSLLYENIIPNTIIIDGIECLMEGNVLQRLFINEMSEDDLEFVECVNAGNGYSLVIYDKRIGNREYRDNVRKIIENIQQNGMDKMYVEPEYISMIIGPKGLNLQNMVEYCKLDCFDKTMIQTDKDKGIIYFGINKTDQRLLELKGLIQKVIDNCKIIKLSAKEWKYLTENKGWNTKMLQNEFTKCCISLCSLSADRMLFYGSDNVRNQMLNKIKFAVNAIIS